MQLYRSSEEKTRDADICREIGNGMAEARAAAEERHARHRRYERPHPPPQFFLQLNR